MITDKIKLTSISQEILNVELKYRKIWADDKPKPGVITLHGKILSNSKSEYNPKLKISISNFPDPFTGFQISSELIQCPDTVQAALLVAGLLARFPNYSCKTSFPKPELANSSNLNYNFLGACFNRIMMGRLPSKGLRFLDSIGYLDIFLPELTAGKGLSQNRFHAYDIYEHLLHSCDGALEADLIIRWSALLHDIGKVSTRKLKPNGEASFHNHEVYSAKMVVPIMKRLGIPRKIGKKIQFLVRNHMFHYTDEWTDKAVRRFLRKVNREDLDSLIALRMADRRGSGKKKSFPKALQSLIEHIDQIYLEDSKPKVTNLAINGNHLKQEGVLPGPSMGELLKSLLEEVTAGTLKNNQIDLLQRVREKCR